jgi:hypothetical protein
VNGFPEPVQQLQARRRFLVGDVHVRHLREQRQTARGPRARRQGGAVDERLPRSALEHAVAVSVDVGPAQSRAGRVPVAAGREDRPERRPSRGHCDDRGDRNPRQVDV